MAIDRGSIVGPLGLLNGLFGAIEGGKFHGWGPFTAQADGNTGLISKFVKTGK
jgi:hypothetical protein